MARTMQYALFLVITFIIIIMNQTSWHLLTFSQSMRFANQCTHQRVLLQVRRFPLFLITDLPYTPRNINWVITLFRARSLRTEIFFMAPNQNGSLLRFGFVLLETAFVSYEDVRHYICFSLLVCFITRKWTNQCALCFLLMIFVNFWYSSHRKEIDYDTMW